MSDDDDDFAVCLTASGQVAGAAGACATDAAVWDALLPLRGDALNELRTSALLAAWPLAAGAFWLPADAAPQNALEALAAAIFQFHTAGAEEPIDPATSGCEWWCNVTKSELLSSGCGDIGFHFDKDERAYSEYGLVVQPLLSTVTYLTDDGAPTILLPHVMLDEGTVVGGRYTRMADSGSPSDALLVPPRAGRHLCFDGRWLHGAPAACRPPRLPLSAASSEVSGDIAKHSGDAYERVTFLVNIWINHRPGHLRRFTTSALVGHAQTIPCLRHREARRVPVARRARWHGLHCPLGGMGGCKAGAREHSSWRVDGLSSSGQTTGCHRFPLEQTAQPHELRLPAPPKLALMLRRGCVVRLVSDAIVILRDSPAPCPPESVSERPAGRCESASVEGTGPALASATSAAAAVPAALKRASRQRAEPEAEMHGSRRKTRIG